MRVCWCVCAGVSESACARVSGPLLIVSRVGGVCGETRPELLRVLRGLSTRVLRGVTTGERPLWMQKRREEERRGGRRRRR